LLSVLSTTSSEGHGIFQRCLYKAADLLHLNQWSIMVAQVRFTCLLPPPPSSSPSASSSIWTIFIYIFLLSAAMFADCSSENQPLQVKAVEECSFLYDGNKTINGTFATPGYPNTYPADTRCRFRFRGRRDQVVWILWSDFHLEGPLPYQRCLHDYVEVIIIDRQNVQHISGRYCGNKKPPDFKTMQRSVDIIFQSSFSKHFQGFSGVFMFINEREVQPPMSHYPGKSNPHSVGCGGFAQGIHGGVIKSPEYPEKYPENVECNWVIRVRPDKQIFIKILELQLTPGFRCEDAQLEVIDGYAHYNPNEEAALSQSQRVRFCGEEKYYREEGDKSYMSDRNRIHIRFKTSKPAPEQMKYKRQEFGSVIGFYLLIVLVFIVEVESIVLMREKVFVQKEKDIALKIALFAMEFQIVQSYSKELLASGIFVLVLLIFVILSVVYWQRCHSRKQLHKLIHGRSLTSRRAMNEDLSEKGDLIWQPKSDQCADAFNELLDNGQKKVTGEIRANTTTMDNACLQSGTYRRRKGYEEQNHVTPLTFLPNEHAAGVVVNFKSDIQLANNSDILRSRIPSSSHSIEHSTSTYAYQPSAIWQQRTDLHQFTFAPTQLLVTSLSDETSADTESEFTNCTKKRIKKSLPVMSNLKQQKTSRERQNTVAQCSLYQPAACQPQACSSFAQEETKNPNNLKCILKSHSSSSGQQDRLAAEMVYPNKPTNDAADDDNDDGDDDDDQLRCSNIKLQSQANSKRSTNSSSKLKTSKQRVEFSDIVTVRIRPSDVSDEEEIEIDDHQIKTADCPSNTNNINKTTTDDLGLKPTVV
ncbi:CUB domain-containing protein 2, partial [Trichinella pseudospiralis]